MSALLYGLHAGLSFSPHILGMMLLTIANGRKKGLIFMLSGLAFDLLLIITLFLLASSVRERLELPYNLQLVMKIISGLLVIRMGLKAYKAGPKVIELENKSSTIKEGFIMQVFNPNPYLFWFFIGVPTMVSFQHQGEALKFVFIFLLVTYGIKALIVEICTRFSKSDIMQASSLRVLRKSVALLMMANGFYLFF